MSLVAMAALLGHRSMRMTLTYACISNRTVAEEYSASLRASRRATRSASRSRPASRGPTCVGSPPSTGVSWGNGHCAQPTGLDCTFESVCERWGFFETGPQFLTILRRQRDDADRHGQEDRAQLLEGFIEEIDQDG
jgi:hypothetical protein